MNAALAVYQDGQIAIFGSSGAGCGEDLFSLLKKALTKFLSREAGRYLRTNLISRESRLGRKCHAGSLVMVKAIQ